MPDGPLGDLFGRLTGRRRNPAPTSPPIGMGTVGAANDWPLRPRNPNATGYGNFSNPNVFPPGGVGSPQPGQGGVNLPPPPDVLGRFGIRITPAQWSLLNQPGVFGRLVGGQDPRAAINALPLSRPNLPITIPVAPPPPSGREPINPVSWNSFGNRYGPNLSLARAGETSQPRGGSFMPTYTDLSERDPYNRLAYKFSSLVGRGGPY